jgi:hypothetical protein
MRRLLLALLPATLLACSGDDPVPTVTPTLTEAVGIVARGVDFDAGGDDPRRVGGLRFRAGFELTAAEREFGGFSGMAVDGDGRRLVAVSDHGWWLVARLTHDADGTLTGVARGRMGPLLDLDGAPLAGRDRSDAEELAALPGRGLLVSFEREHRTCLYPAEGDAEGGAPGGGAPAGVPPTGVALPGVPRLFPVPAGVLEAEANEGMEAMTLLGDGRLVILTENQRTADDGIRGWIGELEEEPSWQPLELEPTGTLRPTGAAALPGGDLLLLERSFSVLEGLEIRLSRIAAAEIVAGARLVPRELARLESPLPVDNMESVAVRTGPAGEVLVYLLSDDNFNDFQRTLLLQFELL